MTESKRPSTAIPFAVACLGIALFSAMDAAMKGLSIALGAYNAMLWRGMFGTVIGAVPFVAFGARWPSAPALRLHLIRGAVVAVMAVMFFFGITRLPLAEAIALTFIGPLIALYLAAVVLGETVERRSIGASLLGIVGVAVMVAARWSEGAGERHLDGVAAILFSAVLYAINLILARRQAMNAAPGEVAFFQSLSTTMFLLLAAPFWGFVPPVEHVPMIGLAALLAVTSLFLLGWAYARAEAQLLVNVEYTAFIWAAILGAIFYDEAVTATTLFGTGLIVAGSVLVARRGRSRPAVPEPAV